MRIPNFTTVMIADDHVLFRQGLKYSVTQSKEAGIQVVGEASNGEELIKLVEKKQPQVVITDIKMPVMDGIEASRRISEKYPQVGIIALSMYEDDQTVLKILDSGISSYLPKTVSATEIIDAIHATVRGASYFSNSTSQKLLSLIATSKQNPFRKFKPAKLTQQEVSIIRLICDQHTSKEIGDILHLSTRTIEDHRHAIQDKVNARNVVGVALYAAKSKIIKIDTLI